MISRIIAVLVLAFLSLPLYALDWKNIHEEADSITSKNALALLEKETSLKNLYLLGLVYLNEHKDDEALDAFSRVLSMDRDSIEAQWGIAESLRRKHRLKESTDILNKIIETSPQFSPAYISLAYIKYTQHSYNEAVRLTNKVINQGIENVDTTNYVRAHSLYAGTKGMIAHYGGPLSKAVNGAAVMRHLKIAQKYQPDSTAVNLGMGSYYLLTPAVFGRDVDKSIEYLEQAVSSDPLFVEAYVRLAQAYKFKGDEEKYQAYLKRALEIDPQNTLALDIKNKACKFICVNAE